MPSKRPGFAPVFTTPVRDKLYCAAPRYVATLLGLKDVTYAGFIAFVSSESRFGIPATAFDDYTVRNICKEKPAKVDLRSEADARGFRTRLRQGAAKGPNFAGHYTIITWGCGVECPQVAVVDAANGKVRFPLSFTPSSGVCYRLDSRLLITDPIDKDLVARYDGKIPAWLKTRFFQWDGNGWFRSPKRRP